MKSLTYLRIQIKRALNFCRSKEYRISTKTVFSLYFVVYEQKLMNKIDKK